jgi:tartrate dehydratase alpha subunit/fumarate hydratase class I-like protein
MFMAKGGGSANKSYLFQETKALLNPTSLAAFLDEKLRALGTAACPPYHLAVVVGGTSAEMAVETAKLASTRYLDTLPLAGSEAGHGFRDIELEAKVLRQVQEFGIGAQFGGKYFCHDVRVIRLPRTAPRARWPSRCRARPTARPWPRSPTRACSSRSSSTTRPGTCPRWATPTSTATWCRST